MKKRDEESRKGRRVSPSRPWHVHLHTLDSLPLLRSVPTSSTFLLAPFEFSSSFFFFLRYRGKTRVNGGKTRGDDRVGGEGAPR